MNQSLMRLNEQPAEQAEAEFLKCCGSRRWASAMTAARPFNNVEALFHEADAVFNSLSDADWLEAFDAHPKIGEKKAATAQPEDARKWSAQEQSRTGDAASEVMTALAKGNLEYERRFGFIYIVCATGKTADELLEILRQRLANDSPVELRIAAKEQQKITTLRLEKLLQSLSTS